MIFREAHDRDPTVWAARSVGSVSVRITLRIAALRRLLLRLRLLRVVRLLRLLTRLLGVALLRLIRRLLLTTIRLTAVLTGIRLLLSLLAVLRLLLAGRLAPTIPLADAIALVTPPASRVLPPGLLEHEAAT